MVRMRAVLLERDERRALEALGSLGLLHLIQGRASTDGAPLEPPPAGLGMPRWKSLGERLEHLRLALGIPQDPETLPGGPPEDVDCEASLRAAEERASELLGRREALRRRREELWELDGRLRGYLGLEIPLERVGTSSFMLLLVGTLQDEGALERLRERLGNQVLVLALPAREGRLPLIALSSPGERSSVEQALRGLGFEEESLPPGRSGTLDRFAAQICQQAARAEEEEAILDVELRQATEKIGRTLAVLKRRIELERSLILARACSPRTDTALLLQGWIPAADAPAVEGRLLEATEGRCVVELRAPEPEEEEEVPVLLRPSRLLRPFQLLVAGYGLPRYFELSPAPFMAVGLPLMFGMMFGDVGHGAILAVAGVAMLLAGKWRDVGLVFVFYGLSSALFGAVYGSYFGLARFRPLALWHDPLEGDPIRLMSAAVLLGVLTISLGLALNVLDRLRHRDMVGALLDRFGLAGLSFYWGALALLVWQWQRGGLPSALPAILFLPVVAWVAKEPVQECLDGRAGRSRPGAGVTSALVEAFETLLIYLANTISFVRLAAYAFSHAALLVAILAMARSVSRPGGGAGLLSLLVFVAGNAVAILLEGIVASVQALRLQYYEFFGKFFSGAGRPFEPFRLGFTGGEA